MSGKLAGGKCADVNFENIILQKKMITLSRCNANERESFLYIDHQR